MEILFHLVFQGSKLFPPYDANSSWFSLQKGTRVTEGAAFQWVRLEPTFSSFDPQFRINPKPSL